MLKRLNFIINSLSMISNRLIQSISTFILSAAIARLLGTYELGQYLLGFSFYFIFVNLASQGLKTLFTRELSRNPKDTSSYLVNGIFLQFFLSLIAYTSLVLFVYLMPYSSDTSAICYIMGLAIFPFALSNITEAIFQAQERMHLIALTTVPIYIIRMLIMLIAMHYQHGIELVATILVISEIFIFLIQWLCVTRLVKLEWQIQYGFIRKILRDARTFFVIEGVAIISNRIDIFILSILGNEMLLGFYGGVIQLLQPFLIIANSMGVALFPSMSKSVSQGYEEQRRITERLIELLMLIALPFLVGILFLSDDLLVLVYGPDFSQAALALQIASFALLIMPFNRALSYLLVANGLEKVNLRELMITTPTSSFLSVFLISQLQLLGAAVMLPVKTLIAGSQYIWATYNRLFTLNFWQIFARPLLVSLLMSVLFWGLNQFNFETWHILLVSTSAYVGLISAIVVHVLGGHRLLYNKLLSKG